MQVQQHIYLQDYGRNSVAVSQRMNDQRLGWCLCDVPEVGASVQTFL